MKKILITGAAGFIGSSFLRSIKSFFPGEDLSIYALDLFGCPLDSKYGFYPTYGNINNIQIPNSDDVQIFLEIVPLDIRDQLFSVWLSACRPDFIFHFAADSSTRPESDLLTLEANIKPFKLLLDYTLLTRAPLVYASSASVYGCTSPQITPRNQLGSEQPTGAYPWSKYSMDQASQQLLASDSTLPIYGLRFFNVFGQGERFKHKTASLIFQWFIQISSNQQPLLFDDSDTTLRDFIDIQDVVSLSKLALSSEPGIYNIGTGLATSFADLFTIVAESIGYTGEIVSVPNPYDLSTYQKYTCADMSWCPGHHSQSSLPNRINQYIHHLQS